MVRGGCWGWGWHSEMEGKGKLELGLEDDFAQGEEGEHCGGSGEFEMLLECNRRAFLWTFCTPDLHLPHRANFTLGVFFRSPFPFPSCSLRFLSGVVVRGQVAVAWVTFGRPEYLYVGDGEVPPVVVTVKRKNESGERGKKGRKAHNEYSTSLAILFVKAMNKGG
jgi:hypothetical protein